MMTIKELDAEGCPGPAKPKGGRMRVEFQNRTSSAISLLVIDEDSGKVYVARRALGHLWTVWNVRRNQSVRTNGRLGKRIIKAADGELAKFERFAGR